MHRVEKKETKVVLLFVPDELVKNLVPLRLLHIEKCDGQINYLLSDLNKVALQQHFTLLPETARTQLLQFSPEQIVKATKEIDARYKKGKAGQAFALFFATAMMRQRHAQFLQLKPYAMAIRTYHRVYRPGTTIVQTLPCVFRQETPAISFTVLENSGLFSLAILVTIDGYCAPLASFVRTAFLVQRNNEYFQLSYPDFQTLEWLQVNLSEGLEQEVFVAKILSRLETAYPVDRGDLLQEKCVDVPPACRVLLSELNNSFLLLTPQWLYDGILVEGSYRERQEISLRGERLVVRRNEKAEKDFLQLLLSLHPNFRNQHNGYYYLSFAEAQKKQWFIKTYYHLLDSEVEVVGMEMLHHFRYSPHQAETTVVVKQEQGTHVRLEFGLRFGKEVISLTTLQRALHAGQRALVLKDGSLGALSDAWLAEYAALVKHGRVQGAELHVSKFLFVQQEVQPGEQRTWQPSISEGWRQCWKQWQEEDAQLFPLPQTIKASLRPYQQKGFEWLALLSQIGAGACLADDMGLGKTLQTICFLAWYSQQHPDSRHLVVCPTSLLYNWQAELKKFAPSLRTEIFAANKNSKAKIIITTYGTLRRNGDVLLTQGFGVVVIDESHNIKNPAAQITRLTQQIEADVRIALSGTPVVNNTFDLYSQLSFALPGLLGNREFFKREYADPIDRYADDVKIKALQRLTAPFILRRTKEQVASDLPSKTEAVIWCTMSPGQEELYNEIREQVRNNLFADIKSNGIGKAKLAVLQGLLKLRQVCNDPRLLPADEHADRLQSTKTETLMEELENILQNHKVLVFSQFSSMLQLLAAECKKRQLSFFLLDGQTPPEKRMQMVREFQDNRDAPGLFFISLKAGNSGLTLTAADYVFLFDPWWNTAVEQQAIDRTHRIGQTKNVFSYKLVCKNSIEEKILELQQRKKQLAEELITAEEDFVKTLGEEEIAYLFA